MSEPVIKIKNQILQLDYVPTCVLVGKTGVGKTTLVNMLCGTSHEARQARDSVTRNLFLNTSRYSDEPFLLIDTPGIDSKTETYKHAILLREALTAKKVNTIFVVTKFDGRYDHIKDDYDQVLQMVYKYESRIVVLISHWEHCENPVETFAEISEMLEDCANIICYSRQCSPNHIANLMYSCICHMNPEKLEIPDDDFIMRFNVVELIGNIKKSFDQYKRDASKLKSQFIDLGEHSKNLPTADQDDYLLMLNANFNRELEELKEGFQRAHGVTMNELNDYTLYVKITKHNIELADEYSSYIGTKMTYNINDRNDPRNLIKKCPYCGIIWFRTEGCDGETSCGNVPERKHDEYELFSSSKKFYKYALVKINNVFSYVLNDKQNLEVENEVSTNYQEEPYAFTESTRPLRSPLSRILGRHNNNILRMFSNIVDNSPQKKTKYHIGCGRRFVFKNLPRVDDELILELFKVKTVEEAKALIKEEKFQYLRVEQEKTIDRKFHS